jgi:hypothetical protein
VAVVYSPSVESVLRSPFIEHEWRIRCAWVQKSGKRLVKLSLIAYNVCIITFHRLRRDVLCARSLLLLFFLEFFSYPLTVVRIQRHKCPQCLFPCALSGTLRAPSCKSVCTHFWSFRRRHWHSCSKPFCVEVTKRWGKERCFLWP